MENMNGNGVSFFKPCLKAKYENVGRSISPVSLPVYLFSICKFEKTWK